MCHYFSDDNLLGHVKRVENNNEFAITWNVDHEWDNGTEVRKFHLFIALMHIITIANAKYKDLQQLLNSYLQK